jgi:ABC-type nickel/cobalt efflux system permease component RcnA
MSYGRILLALGFIAALTPAGPRPGSAHPLGNFSISQYTGIQIGAHAVDLRYFIDMAEIPTFQELQAHEIPADPADPRVTGYVRGAAATLGRGLALEVGGRRLGLDVRSADVIFPPGAGDLPTLKLAILFRAELGAARDGGVEDLRFRDDNFAARVGWKEVIAVGLSGTTLVESSVPDRDRSRELSDYPTELLDAPPQVREARLRFSRPPSATVAVQTTPSPPAPATPAPPSAEAPDAPIVARANTQSASRGAFTDLIAQRELTLGVVVLALAVAMALGAFHALEPGHGKTVVAAYLVGARGTARHALILGLIVTASHTAGVYLLGGVTFYASRYVVPERLYPWVALASGLTIAALGLSLFLRRLAGTMTGHGHHHHGGFAHSHVPGHSHEPGPPHAHAPDPDHAQEPGHDHSHDHGLGDVHHHHADTDGHHHHHGPGTVSLRQLWALGITGGIIPCPAALVVLLSALSLRRVGFGLLLIVAFSLGLALVLVAIGMLVVYARRLVARFDEGGPLVTRWLPLTSSAVMTLLGVSIAVQALASGVIPWQLT